MFEVYKIGVVIGIIALHIIGSLLFGTFTTMLSDSKDESVLFFGMYLGSLIAFVALAIFTLEKFGLWGG